MTVPAELEFYRSNTRVESLNTGLPMLLASRGESLRFHKGRVKDVSSYNYMDMNYPPVGLHTFRLLERNVGTLRELLQ